LPGVDIRGDARVSRLDPQLDGWRVELADGSSIWAELVVDASGRGSRLPVWLSENGFGDVTTTVVDAGIGYASRLYAAPADLLGEVAGVLLFPTPDHPYGGVALPVEDGRWVVTAVGFRPDRPPRDAEGFDAFLTRIRDPALSDFVRTARPVGDVTVHRRMNNVRHHYERMERWPPGLLVVGDSLCAFNPVYGQGITVCAQEALLLRRALTAGLSPGTEQRLLRRLQGVANLPWESATGEDLRYPGSEGGQSRIQAVFSRWARTLEALAAHGDHRAQRTLDRMYHMMGSEAELFHPALLAAAARARLFGHRDAVPRPSLTPITAGK
jgi:flavin-dependent dehydrogenase